MTFEYRRGNRKISQKQFFDGLLSDAVEGALGAYADQLHACAGSVVDPETGKYSTVFVRRVGADNLTIHTTGSPAYARALEQRLGLNRGEVHGMNEPSKRRRLVYLAHATEDKELVKPLAEGLLQRGIDVWYDTWEIGYGDSLRRKMEQGLQDCTHFVVLLTETSIAKPWVNEEIDAGLMSAVEGTSKFIGLRYGLPISVLSPLLRTRLCPEFNPGDAGLDELAGEVFGVSRKPPLGSAPRYVQTHKEGSTWSASARAIAEFFVRKSEHALPLDPRLTYEQIQQETGLPMPDVRIGVLDLYGAGVLERKLYGGNQDVAWPKPDLFVTFDGDFMPWKPEADARDLARYLHNLASEVVGSADVAKALGWEARRFNSAAAYLISAKVVKGLEHMGPDIYWPQRLRMGDELLRFVRSV